jgi:hypothetical protein
MIRIADPASLPWHEVQKVDHYWLSVPACRLPVRGTQTGDADGGAGRDAMREPTRVREDSLPYGSCQ